jgi:peroxiredoxin
MKKFFLLVCLLPAFYAAANPVLMPAPDFTITTSDGQQRSLYQDYIHQQKLVLVEAFFTTCPPCNTHAPFFQTLYTDMQAQFPGQIEFLLLSTLFNDTNVKVAQYKTSKGLTMPGAGNDGGSIAALQPYLSGQWGAFEGTPTFFIIAPETGEVFFDIRGSSPSETMSLLQQKIEELLVSDCVLRNPFGNPLEEVSLRARTINFDTTFLAEGAYAVREIAALQNGPYTLSARKSDNPLDGLTTYDLVLISKHILGLEPFECPYQFTAADVNCSGTVTTFDILQARKVILGVDPDLPCGSWRFLPDSAVLSGGNCQDFTGIKLGDVNAGACGDSLGGPADTRGERKVLRVTDQYLQPGETRAVSLYLDNEVQLEGMQLAFGYAPNNLQIQGIRTDVLPDFDASAYDIQANTTRLSWVFAPGCRIGSGAPVLQLHLTAQKGGWLSELLQAGFASEMYESHGVISPLDLHWERETSGLSFSPNPSNGRFILRTQAEVGGEYCIQVTDVQGRVVFTQMLSVQKGDNRLEISLPELNNGLYALLWKGKMAGKIVLQTR